MMPPSSFSLSINKPRYELVRRIQLERSDTRAREHFLRNARLERCKWAVDDVRRKLIARHTNSKRVQLLAKHREGRTTKELGTLEQHKVGNQKTPDGLPSLCIFGMTLNLGIQTRPV